MSHRIYTCKILFYISTFYSPEQHWFDIYAVSIEELKKKALAKLKIARAEEINYHTRPYICEVKMIDTYTVKEMQKLFEGANVL